MTKNSSTRTDTFSFHSFRKPKQEYKRKTLMLFSKKNLILFFLFFILFSHIESRTIKGVVRDIGLRSIEYISIRAKETGKHTISLEDGYFEISVPNELTSVSLIFESPDYYWKTIKINLHDKLKPLTIILIQKEYLRNEILVTPFDTEEQSITLPKAQNIISELEVKEKISETLVETLTNSPGVHFIGSGGFMTTPSIRGLARRRVLLLIDGVRITGDRRAGNSGSFLSPELIKRIEVVRSSSSVIHGSDAIGGVIQVLTEQNFDKIENNKSFNLSLGNSGSRISSGFAIIQKSKKIMINTGFQYSKVSDYRSPKRIINNSGYTNISGVINLTYANKKTALSLRYIGGSGWDIGKPNKKNNPTTFSTVKNNSNHIFLLKLNTKELFKNTELRFTLFINPTKYILNRGNTLNGTLNSSETNSVNSGIGVKLTKEISEKISLTSGINIYDRNDLNIINTTGHTINSPLKDGKRKDTSIFVYAKMENFIGFNLRGGIRYTFSKLRAFSKSELRTIKTDSPSLFFGLVKNFSKSLLFFFNTGTAFRNPSLTESYYTGITGRKFVTGNPNLTSEKSFNIDSGIKIHSGNVFFGFYFFCNAIENMIERYRGNDGNYSYANIQSGIISGGETEFQWFPLRNLELFGHFSYYRGKNKKTGFPLNDIPSHKLFLGGKINLGKSWLEANFLYSFNKSDQGPAEMENKQYSFITLKGGHYFSSKFFMFLKISNLSNELYYPNPDPNIPESKRINVSIGFNFFL